MNTGNLGTAADVQPESHTTTQNMGPPTKMATSTTVNDQNDSIQQLNGMNLAQLVKLIAGELTSTGALGARSIPSSVMDSVRKGITNFDTPPKSGSSSLSTTACYTADGYFKKMSDASAEINLTDEADGAEADSDDVAKQKVELNRLLELYGGIESVCPDEPAAKKQKLESESDHTLDLYKHMIEDDEFNANSVKESCKILGIKYPTNRCGPTSDKSLTPLKKACMLLSMMAWSYYKTNEIVVPPLTAESAVPNTN